MSSPLDRIDAEISPGRGASGMVQMALERIEGGLAYPTLYRQVAREALAGPDTPAGPAGLDADVAQNIGVAAGECRERGKAQLGDSSPGRGGSEPPSASRPADSQPEETTT